MNRTGMKVWLGLCALVALVSGVLALPALTAAEELSPGQLGQGSAAFWDAFLRFHVWGFIACFALLVGLVSLGMATQEGLRPWLVLCTIVGVGYGLVALNLIHKAESWLGSAVFWNLYVQFYACAWRSLGSLGLGVISTGVAVLLPRRSPVKPRDAVARNKYR